MSARLYKVMVAILMRCNDTVRPCSGKIITFSSVLRADAAGAMDAGSLDQARKLTTEDTVRQEVQNMLKEADLDTVSERNIKDQIAKKLGNVEQYKDVIRVECSHAPFQGTCQLAHS